MIKNDDELNRMKQMNDVQLARHLKYALATYVINVGDNMMVQRGLMEVKCAGAGFMLFKRNALEKMADAYKDSWCRDDLGLLNDEEKKQNFALFDCELVDDPDGKRYLSEDFNFCRKWQNIGGKVHVDLSIPMTHVGTHVFEGNVMTFFAYPPHRHQWQCHCSSLEY